MTPLVSVVISTFEGERLIRGCLDILAGQTIAPRLEIIVVDSGSPENERRVVEEFQRHRENVRYVLTERETLYAAWNRALRMATGTFFANFNIDDWLREDALELFAEALAENPNADLAYAHWARTHLPQQEPTIDDVVSFHPPYEPALSLFYCYGGSTQFWRRSSLLRIGGFDEAFVACGDLEVLQRLTQRGGTAVLVPEVLEGFYQNPSGISHSTDVALREQLGLFAAARASVPLERLYDVDPADPAAAADGWVALGNLALEVKVPWHDGPLRDVGFALQCYERALRLVPGHDDALHNRYCTLVVAGRHAEAEDTVDPLPTDEAACVRSADLGLRRPSVEPATRGPVFVGRSVSDTGPARLRGTPSPSPDPLAVELGGAKEYIASLEEHLEAERAESARLRTAIAETLGSQGGAL
jgi:tetratricopeptide (TPR) repeat protein